MKVKFWGVRGSIPAPLTASQVEEKIVAALLGAEGVNLGDRQAVEAYARSLPLHVRGTYGGDTPCLELRTTANDLIIVDAGSGLRALGLELMRREFGEGKGVAPLLLSHYHWDHVQGLPFFAPVYVPGNKFIIYSADGRAQEVLRRQQQAPVFPVNFDEAITTCEFHALSNPTWLWDGRVRVSWMEFDHPGTSYGFRFEADGKTLVYASDASYKRVDEEMLSRYSDFFRDADLLVFDAQFSLVESVEKRDWGHSTLATGVEIAMHTGVERLALFHHDPRTTDAELAQMLEAARQYAPLVPAGSQCEVLLAAVGMEVEL